MRLVKVLAFLALVMALGAYAREYLEPAGVWVSRQFGLPGMALGTFLADAFHFPVPPQFYIFAAVTGGQPWLGPFFAICFGSLCGGVASFVIAQRFSSTAWVRRWAGGFQEEGEQVLAKHGRLAVLLGSVSPLPFSSQCLLAGLCQASPRLVLLILLLRIPRLLFFFWAIRTGWRALG